MTKSDLAAIVDFIGKKFDAQNRRFDAIEGRLDGIETRLGGIEERLGNVEVDVTYLRNRFDRFELVFSNDRLDVLRRLKALEY